MSCLDNTDILRIVGGNSFQIAITVKARRVADGSEIEDFDLSASSPVLNLIHAGEKTRKYFVIQGNQAIISFDGSEGLGYYGMEMSGSYNSEAWRFCIEKVLQLVDTNAKANIPEWSFLVDDTYFIEGTISIYGGGGGGDTVQADWTETNPTSAAFILHKPDLSVYATKTEVASGLAGKQDTIVDLTSIRYGAAAGATAYQKPSSGIPESDMSGGVQTSLGKADSAYQKPASGIPATDMSENVQAALDKANSAVQTESDPVFSNSPAAEITQADINNWNAKQPAIADLADIREGAAAGATAVQPDEMAQAIDGVEGDIDAINAKIPTAASNLNQLADKAYVNSSVATNSATYRGSFNLITDLGMNVDATHAQIAGALATSIATADNNDYAFVQIPDSASTPTVIAKIERYKHNGSGWVYEYDLNNSGFTAAQWAAINSGITSGLVGKLADLPNNSELATLLNGKQNTISDLSEIRSGAAAGATAIQPADLTEALNNVEDEIAGLDESKQDTIEDLSTIRSGAAAGATAYQKPSTGIPESDMSEGVQTSLDKADSAYQKPASGIPATDMSEGVQASLEKANSAVQTETDPVFSNSPAAEISQADINNWNAKQPAIADLADIREGAGAGATAVQPDEMAQAIDEVDGDIADINAKIPTAASNLNQLADKAYVNSSIATNSATYRGSFNLITDLGMNVDATHAQIAGALATAIATADNNDYAFVQIPDSASTPTIIAKIERYKHNGSGWVYEYDLNNSGFTAAQWAAINSGITSGLVGKLADLPNNSELATLLNGKQNVINDLATIRSGASAGATAYQKPSGGIPASDMSSTVQQELSKANTAVQTETDPIFSASPAAGITAQNIQTWNGEPAARQAADNLLRTDLTTETTARQSTDAALQTAIQDETAARIAADALKVNKADVQDISSVAEPMTSATNPISAHAMGVMKQYVDAEVSQKIITPTNGSVVADNATIESTEVETNVHQFAVKPNVFWTKGTNDVAAEPMVGSDKIVTGDGISRKFGYIYENDILGNGSSWRALNIFYDTPILAGQTVVLEFSGAITFAGTSSEQTFLKAVMKTRSGNTQIGNSFYAITGATLFQPNSFVYTASEDCYLYLEGRWHDTETLSVKIAEGIVLEVESVKKNFEQRARGTGMVMHTNTINFNNTAHQVEVGDVVFADPNGDGRLTVPATNVAYQFSNNSTTAVWLVYDSSDSTYKFVSAGNTVWTQIPIAALSITGNSSATPNTSKVNNVFWCACEGWKIDGMNSFELVMARKRGISYVVTCSLINFNNTTHQAEVGDVLLASPTTDARKTISATNVDYSFSAGTTTAVCLVYDLADSAYKFVSTGTYNYNQVVIASLQISGNSSATPNTSKVSDVFWSAVSNWQIDGVNLNTKVDESIANQTITTSLLKVTPITADLGTLSAKTIYNGKASATSVNLCSEKYFEVSSGVVDAYHATGILVRITQYNANKGYIMQTTYSDIGRVVLEANTVFVRISADYTNKGYSSENPISPSDFEEGDFGFVYYESSALNTLQQELRLPRINNYPNKTYFVDASTWKSGGGVHACKVIPVTGGGKIVCTANNNVATRIAFLDTFDEAYITSHLPCPVDGTGNQNTLAGQTKIYDIPATCTYIALNSRYSNNVSLPVSLIIDGKEYMKNLPDQVTALNLKASDIDVLKEEVEELENGTMTIIGRNIQRDAAVRAVGKKAVDTDILPLSFIHVSDIHTKSDNYKCFENACEFYEHYSNIKFMIATGDLVWDSYADQTTWYDLALQKTTKPVLNVIGNHDAGQYKSAIGLASQSSDIQCYGRYIAPYIGDWDVVQPADAATEGKSYYYKDFTAEKVRLIVLNEFETDYETNSGGTGLVYSREYRAMRQAQVTWLINTLDSTPSDYGVIVAYHQPDNLASEDNEFVSFDLVGSYRGSHGQSASIANVYCGDKEWLPKILNAFATKSSLTLTVTQTGAVVTSSPTLVCDCDFTNAQAEFICILNGHTHRDYIGHLTNFPALKVLCVGADNLKYTSGFQPRAEGTPSEDLFNVVNIDRNRKTIKIVRIGSDASVTGQVRDQMIMSYAPQAVTPTP